MRPEAVANIHITSFRWDVGCQLSEFVNGPAVHIEREPKPTHQARGLVHTTLVVGTRLLGVQHKELR